jgi:hypothetical protein
MISLISRLSATTAAIVLLTATHASASLVDITFGIDSFTSVVSGGNSLPVQTVVNGQQINGLQQNVPFTVNGPLGSSVDFNEASFSGSDTHNVISFTPGPTANVVKGQSFLFGTFSFTNGTWFGNADIAFTMKSVSSDPMLNGFTYQDTLQMDLNPFVPGDPKAGADFLYLLGTSGTLPTCSGNGVAATTTCSLRVYELFDSPILPHVDGVSNVGTIELFGMISSLDPLQLKNATGGLFVTNSTTPATTDNNNLGTTLQNPLATPAPPALLLFISGLAALVGGVRRRILPSPASA